LNQAAGSAGNQSIHFTPLLHKKCQEGWFLWEPRFLVPDAICKLQRGNSMQLAFGKTGPVACEC